MIEDVLKIAKYAGCEIMKIYNEFDGKFDIKADNSPITKADITSHNIIVNELAKISPYPVQSEENIVPYEIRKNWRKFWLIDPLDGTKDFIAKNGEFTINIALIDNQMPILGVVYLPYFDEIYYATLNQGAFKNGKKIYNNSKRNDLIATDSNFHSSKEVELFFKKHNIQKVQKYGSSIKICKLAQGEIDVYPRLNGTKEWDTAATQIIANESGCKLIDIVTKKTLIYNKKSYENNHFIASRNDLSFV